MKKKIYTFGFFKFTIFGCLIKFPQLSMESDYWLLSNLKHHNLIPREGEKKFESKI